MTLSLSAKFFPVPSGGANATSEKHLRGIVSWGEFPRWPFHPAVLLNKKHLVTEHSGNSFVVKMCP